MQEFKEKIISSVKALLAEKAEDMNQQLAAIRNDAGAEGKSSMGDKYETTREMLKQEEMKIAGQLELCRKQLSQVSGIEIKKTDKVENGALVRAGNLYFMILTSLGKVKVDNREVFVISALAPVSRQMLGRSAGDQIRFNGQDLQIEEIF